MNMAKLSIKFILSYLRKRLQTIASTCLAVSFLLDDACVRAVCIDDLRLWRVDYYRLSNDSIERLNCFPKVEFKEFVWQARSGARLRASSRKFVAVGPAGGCVSVAMTAWAAKASRTCSAPLSLRETRPVTANGGGHGP
jgi:hypothetical protein